MYRLESKAVVRSLVLSGGLNPDNGNGMALTMKVAPGDEVSFHLLGSTPLERDEWEALMVAKRNRSELRVTVTIEAVEA